MPLGPKLTVAGGTDPGASPDNVPAFTLPEPEVSEAIIDPFLTTKRKATVILALDVSGSMAGERIASATTASADFIRRLTRDDRPGVPVFSNVVQSLGPVAPIHEVGERLQSQVNGLFATGGTAMNDAICEAASLLEAERGKDVAAGEIRLYGIVLMSDGAESSSAISTEKMMATCLKRAGAQQGMAINLARVLRRAVRRADIRAALMSPVSGAALGLSVVPPVSGARPRGRGCRASVRRRAIWRSRPRPSGLRWGRMWRRCRVLSRG